MTVTSPLNPVLYQCLCRRFGDVEVVAPGEALQGRYAAARVPVGFEASLRPMQPNRGPRQELHVDHSGEEYKLDCPFCNDTRKRLFVNHRWSVRDERSGSDNLWLAHCWNEECLASRQTQLRLLEMVYAGRGSPRYQQVRVGVAAPEEAPVVQSPGVTISLLELAEKHPQHPALRYLHDRKFDIERLARQYEIGYCLHSRYTLASDRIYIPIRMAGTLRGWQVRWPRDWNPGDPPKYWSCPNMRRRSVWYNGDRAVKYRTPVIVEGPADVWGYGTQALGVIGKTMSAGLRRKLVALCGEGACVVMLDPEPDEKMKARQGKRYVHHIEKLAKQLEGDEHAPGFRKGVVRVYLPLGTDPGSLPRSDSRDAIRDAAKEQGIKISFKAR